MDNHAGRQDTYRTTWRKAMFYTFCTESYGENLPNLYPLDSSGPLSKQGSARKFMQLLKHT